jgi:molybdopterin converting factor small subunit
VSTKVWFCARCGYEVNRRGRCHSCGERLVASPLPELESGPEDDEVGYQLDQWDDETRGRLIQVLIAARVQHRFEEEELVILAANEARVDRIVAQVTGVLAEDDEDEDNEHERGATAMGENVARDLYDAAKVLREDPTDMQADVALGESSAAVFAVDALPDLDEDQLAAVGRVTRRLLGALGADEALEDEIRHQAEVLCRLLAPAAGEAETEAESERARARLEAGAKAKGRLVTLPRSEVTPGGEMGGLAAFAAASPAGDGGGDGPGAGAVLPAEVVEEAGETVPAVAASEVGTGAVEGTVAEPGPFDEEAAEETEEEEEEGTGELVYELAEWLPEQRVELSMLLEGAGIAYSWDGTDLTVAEEHEVEVDGLFEQVHGALDDDDEARYRSIEELFGAVDRLANDPGNEERRRAFLEAVAAVELPTPVGVDDAYWWRVRSQGHAVVAALDSQARGEEISREAALLAEMLHEMV